MAGHYNNQTRVLHALPPGSSKTLKVLSGELQLTHLKVTDAALVLIRKGLVERITSGCFRLTPDGERSVATGVVITSGPNGPFEAVRRPRRLCRQSGTASLRLPPMSDTLRQRAWTAMRIQRTFTINDLLVASAQGEERTAASNLQRFLKYQLLKDLGEIAPVVRAASGVLHDHNSGRELALQSVSDFMNVRRRECATKEARLR